MKEEWENELEGLEKEYAQLNSEFGEEKSVEEDSSMLMKGFQALDVPASVVRAGAGSLIDEGDLYTAGKAAVGQIGNIYEHGVGGVAKAPTGEELLEKMDIAPENKIGKFAAGVVTEMATDPLTYTPAGLFKFLKPVERTIRNKAGKSVARVLSDYTSVSKYAKEGVDPLELSKRLVEEDLVKHINKPEKLLEVVEGSRKIKVQDSIGDLKKIGKTNKTKGMISEISEDLAGHIDDISKNTPSIRKQKIASPITSDLTDELLDPTSGKAFSPKAIDDAEAYINSIAGKKYDYTLSELYQLKKNLGKEVSSKEFWKMADEAQAVKKELSVKLINRIDDVIKESLSGRQIKIGDVVDDAAKYYEIQNNRLHHLINVRGMLNTVPYKDLKKVNMAQLMSEAGAVGVLGGLGGSLTGSPAYTAMGAALPSLLWTARGAGREMADTVMAKGIDVASKSVRPAMQALPQAGRMMQDEQAQRNKLSFMSPEDRMEMNLVQQLGKQKVPRNSQEIVANPKLLEYKIAQSAERLAMKRIVASGMDPEAVPPEEIQEIAKEIYESNKMLLNEMPEKIPSMLPVWIQQMPELFEDDKYSRIDDVVPMSKRNDVMEEIRKKGKYGGELSTHDMIAQLDELTSSGRYLGDKKKGNV